MMRRIVSVLMTMLIFGSLSAAGISFAGNIAEISPLKSVSDPGGTASVPAGKPFIIQINGKGEKSVFFPHSGQDVPDLKHIRSAFRKSDTLALYPEEQRQTRAYRLYDYRIAKSESSDYQQGTVGTQLPLALEVTVTDNESNPVSGAEIVFSVREGGGVFSGEMVSVTTVTDAEGRASVPYTPGKWTFANPVGWLEPGKNMQNVGLNVVDAYPAAEPSNKVTFHAYGFPGEPAVLKVDNHEMLPDQTEKPVIHHVSEMGVSVRDAWGNPISNLPVTVEVISVTDRGGTSCAMPSQDQRPMLLIPSSEYGNPVDNVITSPTPYEEYTAYGGPMEITSKHIPVYWMVYTGGVPNALYTLKITCGNLTETETFLTRQMGNCGGDSPPESEVWGIFTGAADTETGKLSRISAWLYRYQEEAAEAPNPCGECTEDYIGARRFSTDAGFSSVHFKINGQWIDDSWPVATPYGVVLTAYFTPSESTGIAFTFEIFHTDHPYGWETTGACNCRVPVENTDSMGYSLYIASVLIHTPEQKIIPVTPEGLLRCDIEIPFSIDNFHTGLLKGQLYADGVLVANNHLLSSGEEPFKLFRGYPFDLTKSHTARIVAYDTEDYNTGITGDPIEFIFVPEILLSVYVREPDAFPLLPGGSVQLYAETAEAVSPGDLRWEIAERISESEEFPVSAEISPETGLLTVGPLSGSGYAVAVCRYRDCEYKTARVRIGCDACGGTGTCGTEGGGTLGLDSVNVRMSLGVTNDGRSGGDIFLTADTITSGLYTPAFLDYSALVTGNEVITGADGVLRQVLTPRTFADVVTVSGQSYEVRFYHSEDAGAKTGGLYTVPAGTAPYATWRFENPDASSGVQERFRVTEIRDGESTVSEYRYNATLSSWTLSEGGLRVTEKIRSAENGLQTETETVKDSTGTVSSRIRRVFGTFPWGESVIEKTEGTDEAGLTGSYSWYEDAADTGSYGKHKSVENADGSWIYYEYDASGRITTEYRSHLDIPLSAKENALKISYSHDPAAVGGDSDAPEDRNRPRSVTESIGGVTVSKTFHSYRISGEERTEITEICTVPSAGFGDASGLRTVRVLHTETAEGYAAGRMKRLENPDGTVISYFYEKGVYDSVSRIFTPGSGDFVREMAVHGTVSSPEGTAFKTLKETAVKDVFGHTLLTEEYVCTGTGYDRISWKSSDYDAFGRTVRTEDSAGRVTETAWACCGKESETAEDGVHTAYTHDALKRVSTETRPGPQGNITATYSYDASGRTVTETVTGGGLSLSTAREYDTAGRLLRETDSRGLTAGYAYENGGSRKTVTRPGGITEITEYYADGRVKSVTGTGVIPVFYEYGVNPDSTQSVRVTQAVSGGPVWEETVTDMAGRTVRTRKPGPEGPEISETFYNAKGQIARTAAPGRAGMLYDYGETGSTVTAALDVNANGLTDLSGDDRVTRSETLYVQDGGWLRQRTESLLLQSGSPVFTVTGITQERLSGLASGVISETRTVDAHGNATTVRTAADRASVTVTVTTDYPDSGIDGISVMVSGFLQSETGKTGLTVTYAYDALGRRTQTADPKSGTVITHYNSSGQTESIEAPAGQSVTYGYDPVTGRKISETDAAGKITRYAYNDRDQVTHVWGDVPVPVRYEYDAYGRLWKLHTFRANADFTGAQWPADAGTGDVTEWVYDSATGLLSSKIYADGKNVTYTYLSGGRLHTRTWARTADGSALVTTYGYDPATGELTDTDYSGDTPDIHFTYDRAGRKKTVTDALGTRTLTYDGLLSDTETVTGLYERTLDYAYETAADGAAGRLSGFSAGSDYQVSYGYEHGRISGVNWQTHGQTGSVSYGYENGLIGNILFTSGPTVTRTHDPVERYLTQVKNEGTGGVLSQYAYTHDTLGRRETVTYSGSAFTDGASYRRFSYNDRSEVTESSAFSGADVSNAASPLAPEHRTYTYDPAGNRTAAAEAGQTSAYTSNALNQYTEIAAAQTDIPEYDDDGNLLKLSADGPVMSYDGENRLSSAEYEGLAGDVNGDKSVNLADAVTALQVAAGMTPPNVTVAGDVSADGKIGIGEAVYALQVSAGLRAAATAARKTAFAYDYMGRRVKKAVYADEQLISETLFVYEGWNIVEEITRVNGTESSRYFVWGLDLSQSLQEAGGVGGLLCMSDATASYHYFYDANGNVTQLVNAADGTVAAHYEYDPFGNLTAKSGPYADANLFRFSTKYFDAETGLYYYGFRYYDSELGRWINRDPSGEQAANNLYRFAFNNPINSIDLWGLLELIHAASSEQINGILENGYTSELLWTGTKNSPAGGGNDWKIRSNARVIVEVSDDIASRAHEVPRSLLKSTYQQGFEMYGSQAQADAHRWACVKEYIRKSKDTIFKIKRSQGWYYVFKQKGIASAAPKIIAVSGTGVQGEGFIDKSLKNKAQARWGKAVTGLRIAGRVLIVVGVSASVYEIYTAEDKVRETVRQVGGWTGAAAGASTVGKAGAAIGTFVEPGGGTIIGCVVGGVVGGVGGFIVGAEVTETVYDWTFSKGVYVGGN